MAGAMILLYHVDLKKAQISSVGLEFMCKLPPSQMSTWTIQKYFFYNLQIYTIRSSKRVGKFSIDGLLKSQPLLFETVLKGSNIKYPAASAT